MSYTYVLASTAGGVINDVLSNDPSTFGDWSGLSAAFDEFRVLSMTVQYYPWNRYSKSTTVTKPVFGVYDRSDGTALTTVGNAVNFEDWYWAPLDDPWTHTFNCMAGIEDAGFTAVASVAARGWFKLYQSGLTVSQDYGDLVATIRIQWRQRR